MTTAEQRMAALELANRKRLRHADLRRDLKALPYRDGLRRAADLLATGAVEDVRLQYLLASIRSLGDQRRAEFLSFAEISQIRQRREIRELTDRERRRIVFLLRLWAQPIPRGARTRERFLKQLRMKAAV